MFKKSGFNVDTVFEKNYIGYNEILDNGKCENWNGWACPCFEKDTVIEMLNEDYMLDCYTYVYNLENDTFTLTPNEGFGDYIEEYEGFDIEYNNEIKHVYGIGAYGWCWDEVED